MNPLAAWLVFIFYIAFAFPLCQSALIRVNKRFGEWIVGLLLLPYLLAIGFHPSLGDLLCFAILLALPTICLRLRPQEAKPFDLFHILAILTIWVTVEVDLFILILDIVIPYVDLSAQLSGFSLLPKAEATLVPGMMVPVHLWTFVPLTLLLFLVLHPLEGIGFTFHLDLRDLKFSMIGFLAFIIAGLFVGLEIGFLHLNLVVPGILDLFIRAIGIYVLVALAEEVFFRGIIQNLLTKRLGNERLALVIASIIFGLSHLNNPRPRFPAPNWAYVLMATIAGLAYGWVWIRTRKVTASAITHMATNLIWSIIFHEG